MQNQSGLVYSISCKDCDASYAGGTRRRLEIKVEEHKKAVSKGDVNTFVLAEHSGL